jgi:hydroxyacylglutathione hydrolase
MYKERGAMRIKQFRYSTDNLGYLVYSEKSAVAIDPGAASEMFQFSEQNHLKILYVTNTHTHHDHLVGNSMIIERTGAQFLDSTRFKQGSVLALDDEKLDVLQTPGHTNSDVTFKTDAFIITGDTLFNGTVGNCFSRDLKAFFNSLKLLTTIPHETKVYAGHDYVKESISIARTIEKDNPDFDEYLEKYDARLVVSTIGDELRVNPYIRFNAKPMIELLKDSQRSLETEYDRFIAIMETY